MRISEADLTLDDLQNGYYIYQRKDGFRFGVDAVLLSDFAEIKYAERVMDLGTGNGIIPILLAAKNKGGSFVGIDILETSVEIARMSAAYNHLEDKITFETADLKSASEIFGRESFDAVVSNPPYMAGNDGRHSGDPARAMARHEVSCNLDDVVRNAAELLKTGGKFFLIHRPFRLVEIISAMTKYHLEPKRMRLVYPYADREPTMVLLEGLKGGKSQITVEKPLIMYEK